MKIAILCPSRGRPQRFTDMVKSAMATASDVLNVHVMLLVDRDDPCLNEYVQAVTPAVTLVVQEERVSCPAALDILAGMTDADLLIAGADDILFRTPGWDRELAHRFATAFPDRLGFAFFNDGRDRDKAEHFAVSQEWVKAVGYFMRPEYEHFCADEHVERIAKLVNRRLWLGGITLEHMHFKYGKAAKDQTYAEKRTADAQGKSVSERDNERLRTFDVSGKIAAAAQRVRSAIELRQRAAA
jgi:hypothetical protein